MIGVIKIQKNSDVPRKSRKTLSPVYTRPSLRTLTRPCLSLERRVTLCVRVFLIFVSFKQKATRKTRAAFFFAVFLILLMLIPARSTSFNKNFFFPDFWFLFFLDILVKYKFLYFTLSF